MNNGHKPGIRIIAERISVTTIRARSKMICAVCRRSLIADEIDLAALVSESRDLVDDATFTTTTDNEKEK